MIERDEVLRLYRLILDREPESEDVVDKHRRAGSVSWLAFAMLMSDEFVAKNRALIGQIIDK